MRSSVHRSTSNNVTTVVFNTQYTLHFKFQLSTSTYRRSSFTWYLRSTSYFFLVLREHTFGTTSKFSSLGFPRTSLALSFSVLTSLQLHPRYIFHRVLRSTTDAIVFFQSRQTFPLTGLSLTASVQCDRSMVLCSTAATLVTAGIRHANRKVERYPESSAS